MFYRPASRLFAIKFLGLFGGANIQQQSMEQATPAEKKPNEAAKAACEAVAVVGRFDAAPYRTQSDASASEAKAIELATTKILDSMLEHGTPGLTICVSKRGRTVWNGAFGFCDVENRLVCLPEARMRIGSISKSVFAATIIGKLIDEHNLDIDSSIHAYLSAKQFPKQKYQDKEVDITIKQLLSHTSGIRHYDQNDETISLLPIGSAGSRWVYQSASQYRRDDFYQRKTYRSVMEALKPILKKELAGEPGKFLYTTFGYTVLSAVAESAWKKTLNGARETRRNPHQIEDFWIKVLQRDWHMTETSLDQDEPVLSNRARHYLRSGEEGRLINAPYTDNSIKWAGGGLMSSARDLIKFGDTLIDSYKGRKSPLKTETLKLLWTEVSDSYCLGFETRELTDRSHNGGADKRAFFHTGSALGASSVMVIYPESEVVVAILTNLGHVNLSALGLGIASAFAQQA